MASTLETFARYSQLIAPLLADPPAFDPQAEDPTSLQVERCAIYTHAVLDPKSVAEQPHVTRLIDLARWDLPHNVEVIDAHRNARAFYRPLLIYSWLQAFRLAYELLPRTQFGQWEEAVRPWCDDLEEQISAMEWLDDFILAAQGEDLAAAVWSALALHVAGKIFIRDAWTDQAADTFGRLTKRQQPSGSFLLRGDSDSPDVFWFHELAILHASANFAVLAEDRAVAAAVQRNTIFHQNEIQPDHATGQPFALFAFIWNSQTNPMADQILHAQRLRESDARDNISLMLLADSLYCMRLFMK